MLRLTIINAKFYSYEPTKSSISDKGNFFIEMHHLGQKTFSGIKKQEIGVSAEWNEKFEINVN